MINVTISRYVLGLAGLAVVTGSLGFSAIALRRRYLPGWSGALAALANATIGLALLIALLELLGAVGLFSFGPIVVGSLILGFGVRQAVVGPRGVRARAARARDSRLSPHPAAMTIALIGGAVVTAEWTSPTLESYDIGIRTFDSLWYHLPWAASFAQTAHITPLRFTDVEYLTAFYPATAELLHGLGIVLLARDTLSPALNLAWLGLALLAAYCIGRPWGVGPATLLGAALALSTPMMVFSQAGSAANDVLGVFFLLAAAAFLMNGASRRAAVALAAVAAGLAVAVKLSLLAPVLALTVGAIWVAPRGRRRATAALWCGALVLAGGFWYVRNLIAVGNPLPWLNLPGLATPAGPLQQHTAFTVAHYLTNSHVLSGAFERGLAAGLGPWWPVVLGAAVVGPVLCVLPGSQRTVRMLGVAALASLGAYLVTPESAAGPAGHPLGFAFNLRYAAPALTLSLAILPLAPVLAGARQLAGTVGTFAIVIMATVAQARLWPSRHVPGALGIGIAVLVAAIVTVSVRNRRARWRAHGGRSAAALLLAGAATLLAVAAAGGYVYQRHYLRGRYTFQPGVSSLSPVWALFRRVHNSSVGLVGTFGGFFSYPLFGADGSNRVTYVARHGPHGSFTPIATCPQWRAAVNAGAFRYLVTTPARDPWHPTVLSRSPEDAWTGSDPAAYVTFSRRAVGQPITVYALRGRLDPAKCPRGHAG